MKSLIVAIMVLFATPALAQVQLCIDLTANEQTRALAAKAAVEAERGITISNVAFAKALLRQKVISILAHEQRQVGQAAALLDRDAILSDFPDEISACSVHTELARCGEGSCTGGDVCTDTGSLCECVTP